MANEALPVVRFRTFAAEEFVTAMDRRAARTRVALQRALIDLTVERGYASVSVQQVLERAGIARSTFYAHYRDKDSLLKGSIDNLSRHLQQSWAEAIEENPKDRGQLAFVLPFLRHVAASREVYRALYHSDIGPFVERNIGRMIAGFIRADLDLDAADPRQEGKVQAIVGALSSLVSWWMDTQAPLSAEEVNELFLGVAHSTNPLRQGT